MPNRYTTTFSTVNTPAFTTATACNSAETGVGATMAAGNQRWKGISAALPMPNMYSANSTISTPSEAAPPKMPPSVKSKVPVSCQVQMMATSWKAMEVVSRMPR